MCSPLRAVGMSWGIIAGGVNDVKMWRCEDVKMKKPERDVNLFRLFLILKT